MIAVVGVRRPRLEAAGTRVLTSLPACPAGGYSAALIRCVTEQDIEQALAWYSDVKEARNAFPIGLAAPLDAAARLLGPFALPVHPVLSLAELPNGSFPGSSINEVRRRSIEGALLEELVMNIGTELLEERRAVECLVYHAIRGGTVDRVARQLDVHPETVRNRLRQFGLRLRRFMSDLRIRAYHLAIQLGDRSDAALAAGGWHNQKARLKAEKRVAWADGRNGEEIWKSGGADWEIGD